METILHSVYTIHSPSSDVSYKGYSLDPVKRLEKDNAGRSTYTSRVKDWNLVLLRKFELKNDVLNCEKMLKRQNRKYLEWIIPQYFNIVKAFY
jgi:putative endonuclease